MKTTIRTFLIIATALFLFGQSQSLFAAIPYDGRTTTIADAKKAVALMNEGAKLYDKAKIEKARKELIVLLKKNPNSDELKYLIAKSDELEANIIRHYDREQEGLTKDQKKAFRSRQKELGEEGISYLEGLSISNQKNADILTLVGVLYTHKISGMFSGLANGPKAKKLIRQALELEPDNPRVLAAYGRMYVYNPPFAGGNLEKAEETYKKVIELDPKLEIAYTMLARTYHKQDKPTQAELYLRKVLEINPDNKEAKLLLKNYTTAG